MNQEENTRRDVERLESHGLNVFLTFPQRVADGVALVARLAALLADIGPEAHRLVQWARDAHRAAEAARASRSPARVFVPIWMDPLMTIHGDTFISDQLDLIGLVNVFADRPRRYPLAADLGRAAPMAGERVAERDTRYPRVTIEEVVDRKPDLILLPDEPHAFDARDAEVFRTIDVPAATRDRVLFCKGKHLMWPGVMSLEGLAPLEALAWADP
jgi:ABC-type Fe3+-hydroxamate transport system substrate-binding protein